MRVHVTATVFRSRVVYGFSNKDYGYYARARRPLDGTFNYGFWSEPCHLQLFSVSLVGCLDSLLSVLRCVVHMRGSSLVLSN